MTEAQWEACDDPQKMLEFLGDRASERKLQLFSCGCCRHPGRKLTGSQRCRVEAAEGYADGTVGKREMREQWTAADLSWPEQPAVWALAVAGTMSKTRWPYSTALLRCVFGNPFRPAAVDPAWLASNDGAVVKLARAAYDERLPTGLLDGVRLAILADALEEAGCADESLLTHLRGPGPHIRGCFVIDLLLARE